MGKHIKGTVCFWRMSDNAINIPQKYLLNPGPESKKNSKALECMVSIPIQ